MLQAGPLISLSPSFNSYSSSGQNLADIAARVVSEFRRDAQDDAIYLYDDDQYDAYHVDTSEPSVDNHDHDDDEDESEFEFTFFGRESASSPISADEIFDNGRIRAVYPLFGRQRNEDVDVKAGRDGNDETALPPPPAVRRRQPLRKLMVEEGFATSSCSSSETDELDGLKDGTYCVWRPGSGTGGEEKKKSKSTGTVSRRWKFRGLLLHRSNSEDGKGDSDTGAPSTFLVATRKSSGGESKRVSDGKMSAGKGPETGKEEDEKKKPTSFLPYKQDLVGFLANVNGLSRNLHPF